LLVNLLASQRRHPRGSGSTSVQEMLEAQPSEDGQAEEEFRAEFQRRAFRWAAERVKHEFTDSTWQAFWRTGVENQPIAVVAKELGLSTGAVYIARSRILARLRHEVEQLTDDTGLNLGDGSDDRGTGEM
jgi:DNA-directed RNA polymerase specialized sigma24 family protein